ncbi:VWA domain-containing protein [Roseimaritima ulvae]|uniref:von Willebrand factor type A domain protein n=1 Tax=Roseimaritima ulvae TaxID=980254 RepID=A0A5B9QHJ0_9BACT|nr:VWA domain-containing protein [Roseimaritima ulvae]QEG38597.1 von Willebrand factor type A domain protein [Roseimaritima ulvae]
MRIRGRDVQVFSVSFLDVISCALGGTLLLLLAMEERSQQIVQEAQHKQQQAETERDAAQENVQRLAQLQKALTGLGGNLKHVVYVIDVSGSMAESEDSNAIPEHYLNQFCLKITELPSEDFNVVSFNHEAHVWQPNRMLEHSDRNVERACAHVRTLRAENMTNTYKALQAAYGLPGVDTIILFTDGDPSVNAAGIPLADDDPAASDRYKQELVDFVAAQGDSIILNTVAIGEKVDSSFLSNLAAIGGGANTSL